MVAPNRERIETIADHRSEQIVASAANHLRLAAQPSHRRCLRAQNPQTSTLTPPNVAMALWVDELAMVAFRSRAMLSAPSSCSGSGGTSI
jgi:hypothetical protein